MNYIYIFGTIFFTVYGQLILKWRVVKYGDLPQPLYEKIIFLFKLIIDPFILSGFVAGFVASLFWLGAMTKFELNYAYPFTSLAFVLVFMLSVLFFNESVTIQKIVGLSLIVLGIIITSRSV